MLLHSCQCVKQLFDNLKVNNCFTINKYSSTLSIPVIDCFQIFHSRFKANERRKLVVLRKITIQLHDNFFFFILEYILLLVRNKREIYRHFFLNIIYVGCCNEMSESFQNLLFYPKRFRRTEIVN